MICADGAEMLGNAIGGGAFVVFILAWLGMIVWWFTRLGRRFREYSEMGLAAWSVADFRARFVPWLLISAVGVAAALVGFAFGEWPRN
jgi:hypothetical protein